MQTGSWSGVGFVQGTVPCISLGIGNDILMPLQGEGCQPEVCGVRPNADHWQELLHLKFLLYSCHFCTACT